MLDMLRRHFCPEHQACAKERYTSEVCNHVYRQDITGESKKFRLLEGCGIKSM